MDKIFNFNIKYNKLLLSIIITLLCIIVFKDLIVFNKFSLYKENYLLMVSNSYFFYLLLFFLLIYAVVRYLEIKEFQWKDFLSFTGQSLGIGLLALALSAVALLLLPQLFFGFKKKEKVLYATFSMIVGLLLIFPYFSFMTHGLERIQYRWIFIVVLFLVLLTARIFDRLLKGYKIDKKLLMVYTLIMLFLFNKRRGEIFKLVLVLVIGLELGFSAYNNLVKDRYIISKRDMEQNNFYYFDHTVKTLEYLKENESNENFYRIDKYNFGDTYR
jgi:hypothetical protein